jgi:hypothetical protein
MRITDSQKNELDRVYLALTDAEARELLDGLNELLKTREFGWHAHVMDERALRAEESERVEREITVYRADDATAVF